LSSEVAKVALELRAELVERDFAWSCNVTAGDEPGRAGAPTSANATTGTSPSITVA
jgi:hypothetical protein